jgi:hypothetical protein
MRTGRLTASQLSRAAAVFHEGVEDQHGGHLVHDGGAAADTHVGFAQEAVSLRRGEALVPEVNGELEVAMEFLGKNGGLFGLNALGAAHAKRKSDNKLGNFILINDALESGQVGALIFSANGSETLGGDAERIGDGESDGLGTDVEAEKASGM